MDLPAGTVVSQHRTGANFTFSWESEEGLHIVRSETTIDWEDETEAREKIAAAVRDFTLAVALEILNEYRADRKKR